jgi:hypothetical protein
VVGVGGGLVFAPRPVRGRPRPGPHTAPARGAGRPGSRSGARSPPGARNSRWSRSARSGPGPAWWSPASRPPAARVAAAPSRLCRSRDPVGRGAAQRATLSGVDHLEPVVELCVEVGRAAERAARAERALQVIMAAFDQPFGFGIGRSAHDHLHPECAAERLAVHLTQRSGSPRRRPRQGGSKGPT